VTSELLAMVRGLLWVVPTLRSPDVKVALEALTGQTLGEATVRRAMQLAGVSQPGGFTTVVGYMIRGFYAAGQTTAMRWYRLKQETPSNNEFIDMPPGWLALRQVDPGAGQQVHFMGWVWQPDPV
jgi:hypothetical protein